MINQNRRLKSKFPVFLEISVKNQNFNLLLAIHVVSQKFMPVERIFCV